MEDNRQILNFFFLANDILQKAKTTDNTRILKSFQTQLPDVAHAISASNLDRSLCKEILKIMRLWRDRAVYPDTFLTGIIGGLEKSLQDKKKERGVELPDTQVEFEDLYNFALNKKNHEMWVEKVNELKAQLDIILKHSRTLVTRNREV